MSAHIKVYTSKNKPMDLLLSRVPCAGEIVALDEKSFYQVEKVIHFDQRRSAKHDATIWIRQIDMQ
jgi:hypothetical protein